jgi:DNA-binding response OmpR family regulator
MDAFMESLRNDSPVTRAGDISLDWSSLTVAIGDHEHRLTPTEASLLDVLMRHCNRIVRRDEIERALWPNGARRSRSLLPVYIHGLRKVLEPVHDAPRRLINVVGRGYMLRSAPGVDSAANPPTWRRGASA